MAHPQIIASKKNKYRANGASPAARFACATFLSPMSNQHAQIIEPDFRNSHFFVIRQQSAQNIAYLVLFSQKLVSHCQIIEN